MSGRFLWDRKDGESIEAKAAFDAYKYMGPSRSYAKVAKALGKHKPLVDRWGREWSWVERAKAWDDHLQKKSDAKLEDEHANAVMDANKRHLALVKAFQAKIAKRLASVDPDELSTSDLIRWLDTSVHMERDILGLTGKDVASGSVPDDGFIEALERKVDEVWDDD